MRVTVPQIHSSTMTSPTTSKRRSRMRSKSWRASGIASICMAALLLEDDTLLDQIADDVRHRLMHLLNDRRIPVGPEQYEVGDSRDGSAAVSGERHGHRVAALGFLERKHDVLRRAAGGKADDDVAWLHERFDLPFEHAIVAVVVADCGDRRRIDRKRFAVQTGTLAQESPAQFRGHVLRLGGAAAVAHPQNLVAATQRLDHCVRDRFTLPAIMRRVVDAAAVGKQVVKTALAFDVYGSIQNSS